MSYLIELGTIQLPNKDRHSVIWSDNQLSDNCNVCLHSISITGFHCDILSQTKLLFLGWVIQFSYNCNHFVLYPTIFILLFCGMITNLNVTAGFLDSVTVQFPKLPYISKKTEGAISSLWGCNGKIIRLH